MNETEIPDTTEAVAEALYAWLSYDRDFKESEATNLARAVVIADRQSLAEQGYVICKPVVINESDFQQVLRNAENRLGKHSMSAASEIASYLEDLRLPIEVVE